VASHRQKQFGYALVLLGGVLIALDLMWLFVTRLVG